MRGILHSMYAKEPFTLDFYVSNWRFDSTTLDNHAHVLHFPSGIPLEPDMVPHLTCKEEVDVHYEPCILELEFPDNAFLATKNGLFKAT